MSAHEGGVDIQVASLLQPPSALDGGRMARRATVASGRPKTKPDMRAHCSSLSTRRSIAAKAALRKAALNHSEIRNGTLSVHRT